MATGDVATGDVATGDVSIVDVATCDVATGDAAMATSHAMQRNEKKAECAPNPGEKHNNLCRNLPHPRHADERTGLANCRSHDDTGIAKNVEADGKTDVANPKSCAESSTDERGTEQATRPDDDAATVPQGDAANGYPQCDAATAYDGLATPGHLATTPGGMATVGDSL